MAPRLVVPDGQLDPERDGLAVDAVRASDHQGIAMLQRTRTEHHEQAVELAQDRIGGFDHQNGQRGIEDVGGGQAHMQVSGGRTDLLGDGFEKGDDVVLRDPLQRLDARRLDAGLGPDLLDRRWGDQPFLRQGLTGQKLHFEPGFILARRLPDRFQERPGVPVNHESPT